MALADILIYSEGAYSLPGAKKFTVASGTTASIKAGELVLKALGNSTGNVVTVWTASNTAKPVVATDFLAGLSTSTSTETTTASGTVDVVPIVPGVVYLGTPDTAATWNTQAKYDALVGARVLLSTTSTGIQTILAADGSTSGIVVEPLNILKYPNKVAFSLRAGLSYAA